MLNDERPGQVADWCASADPPPSLEQARAVVRTPFALPSDPAAEVGPAQLPRQLLKMVSAG